jgi:hypothetical protein
VRGYVKIVSMESGIKEKLFLVAVIILIGLIGFGLGRLSSKYQTAELNINSTIANTADLSKVVSSDVANQANMADKTNTANTATAAVSAVASDAIRIIGNKNSKIYHREDCPGALKMSESNKVLFGSISAAKEAGYRPAGNCPGLE